MPAPRAPNIQVISFGLSPDHPALRSSKDAFEPSGITSITVHTGDRIEVRPKTLIRHEQAVPTPVLSRTSETVCTQTTQECAAWWPDFQQKCTRKCKLGESCNLFGCTPELHCADVCETVIVGQRCLFMLDRCKAQEIHWKDETVFGSLGDPSTHVDSEPMKSAAQIAQGIRLKLAPLDFATSVQPVECALDQFKPLVSADTISFTLGNVPDCPGLFSDGGADAGKSLTLINQMSASTSYLEGRLIRTQDGRTLEQPKRQSYDVPIDFVGSISITSTSAR